MRIIIIRHGETIGNQINKEKTVFYTGSLDNELTKLSKEGINQAQKLTNNNLLKEVTTVYSSDISRAVNTAKIIFPNKNIIKKSELRERSIGIFEGKTPKDIINNKQYNKYMIEEPYKKFRNDFKIKAPEGENYTDVVNRTKKLLITLNLNSNETICLISHNHAIKCILYNLLNITKEETKKIEIDNCIPYILEGTKLKEFKVVSNNLKIN